MSEPDDCADEASPFFAGDAYVADLLLAERARALIAARARREAERLYAYPASLLERLRDEGMFDPDDHTAGAYYNRCGFPLLPCATCGERSA